MGFDVYISAKSEDYPWARQLYIFLTEHRLRTFFSDKTLPELGDANYRKKIDEALSQAAHMVVVASRPENAQSGWVEYEWGFFCTEKRSGRKDGNLVTLAVGGLRTADLPPSLRFYEVIPFGDQGFEKVLKYVSRGVEEGRSTHETPAPDKAAPKAEPQIPPARIENSLGNVLVRAPEECLAEARAPARALYVSTTCASNRDYLQFVLGGGLPPVVHRRSPELRTWKGRDCPGRLDHPVVFVLHEQARRFCEWLTAKERAERIIGATERYCLPSLAQWKAFAATTRLTKKAVVGRTWGPSEEQPTEPAASGEPSSLGLFHLLGNVFEWCSDEEERTFQTPSGRVLRQRCNFAIGGGWASDFSWLRKQVDQGDFGTVWGPPPWPMKDGGFRICLLWGKPDRRKREWWPFEKRPPIPAAEEDLGTDDTFSAVEGDDSVPP